MAKMSQNGTASANIVHLGGWLIISEVRILLLNERQMAVILGWVHTKKPGSAKAPPTNTSYPVVFAGATADILLAWAKNHAQNSLIKIITSGKLYREAGQCLVKVKFVEILDQHREGCQDVSKPGN